ncbi:MAG: leucine-rich repeat protein [Oscillospiraceae bacterium]|nr:leucine-rich repeat protein [Oscillospiraceae bacterium]
MMKLFKKMALVALSLAFIFALAGCSAKGEPAENFNYGKNAEEDGIIIRGYKGENTEIVIPEKIDGLPVVTLNDRAFAENTDLVKITIPKTVEEIGSFAFTGCSALEDVVLSEGLLVIKSSAFVGCSALVNINIPESVEEIEAGAFMLCTSLSEESKEAILALSPNEMFSFD